MRRIVTVIAAAALGVGAFVGAGLPATAATRHRLGAEPSWVKAANRRGAVASSDTVPVRVVLQIRNPAEANAVADAVSNPKSASYKHYLTAAQYRARFAPTAASVAAVSKWLRSQGLSVGYVPDNRLYISAVGKAAQASKAFGVHLSKYATHGKLLRAPDTTASVPAELAGVIAGVVGLDESAQLIEPNTVVDTPKAPPSVGFRNAPPCSLFWAEKLATDQPPLGRRYADVLPWAQCGQTPSQLRSAYGIADAVARGDDGHGVRVGIVDAYASPTIFADAHEYSVRNDPAHVLQASQFSQINLPGVFKNRRECGARGWYGEETLDVEAVHAMAPGASIVYAGAKSCFDHVIDVALNKLVDHELVDLVSNSYGNLGEDISQDSKNEFDAIANQAAATGIGLYFSSGDSGDEATNLGGVPATDFSASSNHVTAVGGTSLGVDANGKTVVEQGWSSTIVSQNPDGSWASPPPGDFLYGSGGGTSRLYREPAYQKGVVPDALAKAWSNKPGRVVPDISMVGDPNTGMLIGQTQTFSDGVYYDQYRIGGTSLSSPLFAGVIAVADQVAGFSHGFVNPLLYSLYGTPAFNDVKPGPKTAVVRRNFVNSENADDGYSISARIFDAEIGTLHVTKGYDNMTGIGTPNGEAFLTLLK